jgi:hypothetical protein
VRHYVPFFLLAGKKSLIGDRDAESETRALLFPGENLPY